MRGSWRGAWSRETLRTQAGPVTVRALWGSGDSDVWAGGAGSASTPRPWGAAAAATGADTSPTALRARPDM